MKAELNLNLFSGTMEVGTAGDLCTSELIHHIFFDVVVDADSYFKWNIT